MFSVKTLLLIMLCVDACVRSTTIEVVDMEEEESGDAEPESESDTTDAESDDEEQLPIGEMQYIPFGSENLCLYRDKSGTDIIGYNHTLDGSPPKFDRWELQFHYWGSIARRCLKKDGVYWKVDKLPDLYNLKVLNVATKTVMHNLIDKCYRTNDAVQFNICIGACDKVAVGRSPAACDSDPEIPPLYREYLLGESE